MQEYYERAKRECCAANMGHEPHMLFKVFKMQQNLAENGTMKIANWN
jgi:acetyl-CoA hydrolase